MPAATPTEPDGVRNVAGEVAASLADREGMFLVEVEDGVSSASLLDAIARRLPSGFRWSRVRGPQRALLVWTTLLETAAAGTREGRMSLGNCLRERAQGGVWTVLAVDEADRVSAEVLEMLDEVAGLEPMLQVVLIGRQGFLDSSAHVEASRLRLRIRRSKTLHAEPSPESTQPIDHEPVESVSVEPVPVEACRWPDVPDDPVVEGEGAVPSFASLLESTDQRVDQRSDQPSDAFQSAPDVEVPRVPAVGASRTGRRRERDPFREAASALTLDTPQLLPVLSDPHGVHAESFRVLRMRVEDWLRRRGDGSKSIVVTGSEVSAGKTFVSVNLALLWAASTADRVLLVDGDLRRPQFHTLFQIPRRPGLADVLSRRCRLEESTAFISEVGLHVISAGRAGSPRHLVNPDRVRQAIESMRAAFDIVIFDSPPLSGIVDSRSFAAAADGVLMVVRARETRLPSLQKAMECLSGNNLIGAVVNAATADADSAYSQYERAARR